MIENRLGEFASKAMEENNRAEVCGCAGCRRMADKANERFSEEYERVYGENQPAKEINTVGWAYVNGDGRLHFYNDKDDPFWDDNDPDDLDY